MNFLFTPFFQISRCGFHKKCPPYLLNRQQHTLHCNQQYLYILTSTGITNVILNLKQSNCISYFTNGKNIPKMALYEIKLRH